MTKQNPWERQDTLNKAIEAGAILTTDYGWRFKLRPNTAWTPQMRRAQTAVLTKPEYTDLYTRKAKPDYVATKEDVAMEDAANMESFCRGCVMSFGGVTDRSGKAMKLTVENLLTIFTHFPQVLSQCQVFASNMKNFGVSEVVFDTSVPIGTDAEGNSQGTSDTTSVGSPD